jgi:hypothetical protein
MNLRTTTPTTAGRSRGQKAPSIGVGRTSAPGSVGPHPGV